MIDKKAKAYQEMAPMLAEFVRDLNDLSKDNWWVLVEGLRDESALRTIGYSGGLLTASSLGRRGRETLGTAKGVVVLTDLDREGAALASRFVKQLRHSGVKVSLDERRRLKGILRGIFLHIENLSRFGDEERP